MLKTSNMSSIPTRIPQQHHDPGRRPQADRSPSKLQLMQMQMQQRHMREKQVKMNEFRNQNQNNSYQRPNEYYQDEGHGQSEGSSSVRKFFQERREFSDQNGYAPNINQHYKKVKQGTYQYQTQNGHSPQGQVRNYGSLHKQKEANYARRPPVPVKNSAGRDKAHPLAPIDRTPKQTPQGSRQSSRKSSAQSSNSAANGYGPRPRLPASRKVPSEPVPYESDAENYYSNAEDNNPASNRSNGQKKKSTSFREWQEKQKRIRQISAGHAQVDSEPVQHFGAQPDQESDRKPTDFEKWQTEQDENRRLRLEKHKEQNAGNVSNRSNYTPKGQASPSPKKTGAYSPHSVKKNVLKSRINSRKHLFPSESYADEDDDDEEVDDEISRKQRELEEMINRQQAELTRIQHEREAEDERDRKEKEKRQKRAAEQRERSRKQRETEERDRKEQEERERKQEERERRQREAEQEMENERLSRMKAREQRESPRVQPRYEYVESEGEDEPPPFPRKPAKPSRGQKQARQPAPPPPKQTYEPAPSGRDSGAAFYAQVAQDAEHEKVDLAACKVCGRKFARDRLDKHMKVCKDATKKKRKVFDPVKMRTDGTEAAKYVSNTRRKPEPKPKKSNWREQHDNFIKAIRYAKAVTDAEQTGGDLSALPPPPVTQNSDYKQCPYCERKFNPSTAERHIPRCKDIKSRPAPPRARRK